MGEAVGIGVDIGATRVRACVGDSRGKLLWRGSRVIPHYPEVDDYVSTVVRFVRGAVKLAEGAHRPAGIGVASVGPLDLRRGRLVSPPNLGYDSVPIVEPMERAFGLKVALINDASAGALGERRFGLGKRHGNLVYITMSTGIGGGAIVDGNLLWGKDGNAAEVGHMVVDPLGRLECGCGGKGHWEAYCSGRGIPRLAELIASEEPFAGGGGAGALLGIGRKAKDPRAILEAAYKGGRYSDRLVDEIGRLNSYGVANAANMYDPSLISIGGAVALNHKELIVDRIRRKAPEHMIGRKPEITVTALGDDVGLLGALSLAFGS